MNKKWRPTQITKWTKQNDGQRDMPLLRIRDKTNNKIK